MPDTLPLQKFTTTYSESQDRVKLAGKSNENAYSTVWLSRRLLIRMLPAVISWAEQITSANQPLSNQGRALAQDFAQQDAQSQLIKQAPVRTPQETNRSDNKSQDSWLAHEIDIVQSSQLLQLIFKNTQKKSSSLQLNNIQTRQWLFIIYSQWIKAEWEDFGWPLWIKAPNQKPKGDIH